MHITIINDGDENSLGRQAARTASLFETTVSTITVDKFSELQTAGTLVDILDAYEDRRGIILANAAPRHGNAKKWDNGTPFGYFKFKNVFVFSTIDGLTLSLVKKLNITQNVQVFDIPTVLGKLYDDGYIQDTVFIERIIKTQYRSFEFLPRVAKWLYDDIAVPTHALELSEIQEVGKVIWWIDNYGNCKTSILPDEIGFEVGKKVNTKFGEFTCYDRMKDVPNNETALVIGSSGIDNRRFIEFIIQGQSAESFYDVTIGDVLM